MAQPNNVKISDLDRAGQPLSTAIFPIVQSQTTYQANLVDLLPVADVRMYGTTGTADDTATLVAALAAVAANGVVEIPAGVTLTVTGVTLSSRRLQGAGKLKWKNAAPTALLTLTGEGCSVAGLEIDGNRTNQSLDLNAIETSGAENWVIRDCYLHDFRARVLVTGVGTSPHGLVSGCVFEALGASGVSCDAICLRSPRCTVSDCWFTDMDDGHGVRVGLFLADATGTPVTGSVIDSCHFYDTNHNGVTCELYAQHTTISNNDFASLDQAIKCDSDASIFGVLIDGNTMRDIALTTALNLSCTGVTFSNNRCYTMGGGPAFGTKGICRGNFFDTVGTAATTPTISCGSDEVLVEGNHIKDCPYRAIVAAGLSTVRGNYIDNSTDSAIRISGSGTVVDGNVVDGCTIGINIVSSTTNARVGMNTLLNCSSSQLSFSAGVNFDTCIVDCPSVVPTILHTIAAGVITSGITERAIHTLASEGAAATDDLDTITATTGIAVGHIMVLRDNSSSQDITVKHATGNIHLTGAADFAMTTSAFKIGLQWSGTFWEELWRSTS